MSTFYLENRLSAARHMVETIAGLEVRCLAQTPAPGAPVDNYLLTISPEFFQASVDATAALNKRVCLSAGSGAREITNTSATYELKPLLIDRQFVDKSREMATSPLAAALAEMIDLYASNIGGLLQQAVGCVDDELWTMLAATIRAFNALTQGRPVNTPDIVKALAKYSPVLTLYAQALTGVVYKAVIDPAETNDYSELNNYVNAVSIASYYTSALLACCNAPGVTATKEGVVVDFPNNWNGRDFSTAEIVYLSKELQGAPRLVELGALKDKCIKAHDDQADWYTTAMAIVEYLDAVRNSL